MQVTGLAKGLLRGLEDRTQDQCILAFHDIQAALLASDTMDNEISSLQDFEASSPSGILVVVGVPLSSSQVTV